MKNNKNISISLPQYMIDRLDEFGNRSEVVQKALSAYFVDVILNRKKKQSLRESIEEMADAFNKKARKRLTPEEIVELVKTGRRY